MRLDWQEMIMAHRVDRTMLESVFPPGDLATLTGTALDAILHQPTREFMRDVGLPDRSWLEVSKALLGGEPTIGFQLVAEKFPELDFGFQHWMFMGHILNDTIAVDITTGQVFVRPNGEEPHLLNSSIDEFVYALYLLEIERPNYDFEEIIEEDPEGDESEGYDPGAEDRVREQMMAADPVAFATPHSTWDTVLEQVAEKFF
ncbi:hypothetical protein ABH930_005917 [Kitasatospora sp. GAS204A]|uniref:SUKH-4 family immunity protein n=1 Tax=unclassified Kitasatospora TaxID=2633591 RepID=UPI00247704BE|nr:SUKH-4 family immunity protein [Kitasatospora sp. GAS204B]MDH6121844.1 hypothetical protein [Kitasatospora sp. GAS204B]